MLLVGERGGGFGFRSIAGKDRWAWVRGLVSLGRTAVREDAGRQEPGSQGASAKSRRTFKKSLHFIYLPGLTNAELKALPKQFSWVFADLVGRP